MTEYFTTPISRLIWDSKYRYRDDDIIRNARVGGHRGDSGAREVPVGVVEDVVIRGAGPDNRRMGSGEREVEDRSCGEDARFHHTDDRFSCESRRARKGMGCIVDR